MRVHRGRILRFVVLSIKDMDAAETITQDCFLKAYRYRDHFRGDCSPSTWLLRIAYNLIRDHTRTERYKFWKAALGTSPEVSTLAAVLPGGESSPEKQLLARERLQKTLARVQDLPEQQKAVFLLHFMEEMSMSEIAESLSMPLSTVKTHLYRALAKIRKDVQ